MHHFTVRMSLRRELLPFARFGQADSPTVRYFAERLPIGVDAADHDDAVVVGVDGSTAANAARTAVKR